MNQEKHQESLNNGNSMPFPSLFLHLTVVGY